MRRQRIHGLLTRVAPTSRLEDGENGFTLIELLVVIAILPLVVGAISVALLAVFSNEDAASNSLTASSDAQITSSSFVQDVQGAAWVTTKPDLLCSGASGTLLVSLTPDANDGTTISRVISYVETRNTGLSTFTIYREACTGGTGSPASNTIAVSHNALSTTAITISPSATNAAAANGWTVSSGSTITMALHEPVSTHNNASTSTHSYTISAVPRPTGIAGVSPVGGTTPILPVEFLGPSCPALTLTGGGSFVNSQNGSGTSGSGDAGFADNQTDCTNPTTGAGQLKSQTPYFYGVSNPFSTLAPPSTPSQAGLQAGTCSSTSPSICKAGTYGSGASGGYNNGALTNVTVDPSQGSPVTNVVVFTVPVTIKNTNVTFDGSSSGLKNVVYWFQKGLTVSTGANVTFGSATYIFGTSGGSGTGLSFDSQSSLIANNANGLIFYIEPGTWSVSLSSGITGSVAAAPTPYDGIALWDDASGPFSLGQGNGGGGGLSASFGGIYAPNATLTIAGNYTMSATFMVVKYASVQTSQVTMLG